MDIQEAIRTRHSVRSYLDKPLPPEVTEELERGVAACNAESGLHIQLVTDERSAFSGLMAHYGKFSCVQNYIALVGPEGPGLEEKVGWYGERLVLKAQMLGLNTCWVALTYSRGKAATRRGRGRSWCASSPWATVRRLGMPASPVP